jgi:ubiquinone/menaquinone biosynthesis C-methylase UbiE
MISSTLRDGDKILELGCGTGYFTKELTKLNIQITAIDISPELIEEAQKEIQSENVSFQIQNAYQMDFRDNLFDAVVGSSVLHHLEIGKAVSEIFRVLKPGGFIAFTEPNMMNPQIALQKNIPWLKRKLGDSPDETAFIRWKIKKLLQNTGFKKITVVPFDFLHPAVPSRLIKTIATIGRIAENTPLFKEIAGSVLIKAVK